MTDDRPARTAARPRARRAGLGPRLVLKFGRLAPLTDEVFAELAAENRDLRLERSSRGCLVVMSPVNSDGSNLNFLLTIRFGLWVVSLGQGLGKGYDSSGGFTLPDGSILSADLAWVYRDRLDAVPPERRRPFAHVCPDFVVELRSDSDRRGELRRKMETWLANGVRLGWLIDPLKGEVDLYRPGRPVETLTRPATLSGEDVIPGFVLDLTDIL
jgi:Uma2 family endonuclease